MFFGQDFVNACCHFVLFNLKHPFKMNSDQNGNNKKIEWEEEGEDEGNIVIDQSIS